MRNLVQPDEKILFCASSGGHLAQLKRIAHRFKPREDSLWVTFDTPQARSMLAGERVLYVPYVSPRRVDQAIRAATLIVPRLASERFGACISTGAALAAAVLPVVRARGVRTLYVESVSRVDGPSMTGRILSRVPRIETYTQHPRWCSDRWTYAGTLLDDWRSKTNPHLRAKPNYEILVTLGSIKPYRFDRAVDATIELLTPGDHVTWQLGVTERTGLPGDMYSYIPHSRLMEMARKADVVLTHAGVGTLLDLFELGKYPALLVREARFGEHVDDHQAQIASQLQERSLASIVDLEVPSRQLLDEVFAREVSSV